jgi:hypothetical protein
MRTFRITVSSLTVVLWVTLAHAGTIPPPDPSIRQGGGDPPFPTAIISPAFYIESLTGTSPSVPPSSLGACELFQSFSGMPPVMTGSSPTCFFENLINPTGTGENITQLVFDVLHPGGTVTCALLNTIDFKNCAVGSFDDGGAMVTFSNGNIPFGADFNLQFTGFPKDTDFGCSPISTCPQNAKTSPIPEPGTLVLFVGGIGALLIGRRLRAHSLS